MVPVLEFATEYANAADDGAPYMGPIVRADTLIEARWFARRFLRGPNGEALTVIGEIVDRLPADRHGDTKSWIRRTE